MEAPAAATDYAPNHDEALELVAAAANYNGWIFDRARPYLGRSTLDAGAGLGTFTVLAAAVCDEVVALEPHPPYAELLRERYRSLANVEVRETEIADLEPSGRFDSVICFNVLEHIPDDRGALTALGRQLAPGGHLLVLVPAHPALYSVYDRDVGHVRRYRAREVRQLIAEAGLQPVRVQAVNPVGGTAWLLSKRLLRRAQLESREVKVFDRLVPIVRGLDRVDLRFGLSIWAVARRAPQSAGPGRTPALPGTDTAAAGSATPPR
jgi:SAM-dependent methyltransferase